MLPHEWIFSAVYDADHFDYEKPMYRAPKEVGCAAAASLMVSPLVSVIDKAMVQPIDGSRAFVKAINNACAEMVGNPRAFLGSLSFRLTFAVYFGTYAAANLTEMGIDMAKVRDGERRKQIKVPIASVANIGLLAWRDAIFAREFSGGATPKSVPKLTLSLFAARDFFTMWSTFYLAPKTAEYLIEEHEVDNEVAELSCALIVPTVTQVFTAPVHIYAMDYYSRANATWAERWAKMSEEFNKIAFARSLRILPAFGIGAYSNNKFRELFIQKEEEDELLLSRRVTRMVTVSVDVVRRATTRSITPGEGKK